MARRAVIEGSAALARQEPRFAPIVDALGPADLRRGRPRRTHFAELVRAICYQQLAGAAARTIHGRLEAALGGTPTPEGVLALAPETMRGAGLSANKAASIRDLAEKVESRRGRARPRGAPLRRRDRARARARARDRAVDGGDVPHVPARAARRVAGRRPRRPEGLRDPLRPAGAAGGEGARAAGRPVAPLPVARGVVLLARRRHSALDARCSSQPRAHRRRVRSANGGSPRRARRASTAAGSSTGHGSSWPWSPSTNCEPYSWSRPSFMRTRSAR